MRFWMHFNFFFLYAFIIFDAWFFFFFLLCIFKLFTTACTCLQIASCSPTSLFTMITRFHLSLLFTFWVKIFTVLVSNYSSCFVTCDLIYMYFSFWLFFFFLICSILSFFSQKHHGSKIKICCIKTEWNMHILVIFGKADMIMIFIPAIDLNRVWYGMALFLVSCKV